MAGFGISSNYLQYKKYRQVVPGNTPLPNPTTPPTYEKIYMNITMGGGRSSYQVKGQRAIFFKTTDPKVYTATITTSQKQYFYSGRSIQLSCGCGGGKKTIGIIQ